MCLTEPGPPALIFCSVRCSEMVFGSVSLVLTFRWVPFAGKLLELYSKGHPYPSYPSYIMMTNMNSEPYMNNGSLSPPMPRTVSPAPPPDQFCWFTDRLWFWLAQAGALKFFMDDPCVFFASGLCPGNLMGWGGGNSCHAKHTSDTVCVQFPPDSGFVLKCHWLGPQHLWEPEKHWPAKFKMTQN